jgi:hypothetical protein
LGCLDFVHLNESRHHAWFPQAVILMITALSKLEKIATEEFTECFYVKF